MFYGENVKIATLLVTLLLGHIPCANAMEEAGEEERKNFFLAQHSDSEDSATEEDFGWITLSLVGLKQIQMKN